MRRLILAGMLGLAGSTAWAGFAGTDLFLPMVGTAGRGLPVQLVHHGLGLQPGRGGCHRQVYFLERSTANPSPPYVDVLVGAGRHREARERRRVARSRARPTAPCG